MRTALIATLALLLAGCELSCEQRGGTLAFSHFLPWFNGRITILIPQYTCIGGRQRQKGGGDG